MKHSISIGANDSLKTSRGSADRIVALANLSMNTREELAQLVQDRWPFLQNVEESIKGRDPVILASPMDFQRELTTPTSLQHVGEHIVEAAKADWSDPRKLRGTVLPYLGELIEFWETVFRRHREATDVFRNAKTRPFCLFLRSFSGVTNPISVPGARAVMYLNEPALDANFAATLQAERAWLNAVSCMHTDDMQLLVRSGPAMPAFRVQTLNWKTVVADAIASSNAILFYVDGESPGVRFELDRISISRKKKRTVVVYRGDAPPESIRKADFFAVISVGDFLQAKRAATGSGQLSQVARQTLKALMSTVLPTDSPSDLLRSLKCHIVDAGTPPGNFSVDPATNYAVLPGNAVAFANFVTHLPDSFLQWNSISQDMRLRGIQPTVDRFNKLYVALRMAFASAACLGFTASVAATVGLLAKVASMRKTTKKENLERVDQLMKVLDIAARFDALTESRHWSEKIEAFRQSVLEDPFI